MLSEKLLKIVAFLETEKEVNTGRIFVYKFSVYLMVLFFTIITGCGGGSSPKPRPAVMPEVSVEHFGAWMNARTQLNVDYDRLNDVLVYPARTRPFVSEDTAFFRAATYEGSVLGRDRNSADYQHGLMRMTFRGYTNRFDVDFFDIDQLKNIKGGSMGFIHDSLGRKMWEIRSVLHESEKYFQVLKGNFYFYGNTIAGNINQEIYDDPELGGFIGIFEGYRK